MSALFTAWNASHTRRWHACTSYALQSSNDPVGAHSGRMAILAHQLWPDDTGLMIACLYHDLPESVTGDVPSEAKAENPELRAALCDAEAKVAAENGWPVGSGDHLKFLDRLDAYLWMLRVAPYEQFSQDWVKARDWLLQQAAWLDVAEKINPLLIRWGLDR
jgi:HD containing hydrolase-like enzyme